MKKILPIFLVFMLMMSAIPVFAGSDYEIKDMHTFKQEITKIQTGESAEKFIAKTDPQLITQFIDNKLSLVQEKVSQYELDLKLNKTTSDYIDLGDNCYIRITLEDNPENSTPSLYATSPGAETLWKDCGNRKFTAKYEVWLVLFFYELNLANHYTLDSSGITVRYGDAWLDYSGAASGSYGAVNITKSSAKKGETVSMNCVFTLSQSTVPQYTKVFKMYNSVKCSEIDTIDRQVKVVQSWRGDWLS